jgi:hypothetical protein
MAYVQISQFSLSETCWNLNYTNLNLNYTYIYTKIPNKNTVHFQFS